MFVAHGKSQKFDVGWLAVRCLDWSPDVPYLFASGGQDQYVRVWDIRFPHACLMTYSLPYSDLIVRIRWEGESLFVSGDSNILGCIHVGVSDSILHTEQLT